ncbi:MAG: Holliday junction branch migration DNA helicase RuvB [Actinobacteria bacterium]|nr:MAG: Holliday junction branch migration DNA helicase RuvB [Actinomycetota bacterium]
MDESKDLISAKPLEEELFYEQSLRPKKLSEFIGQQDVKKNLEVCVKAVKKRSDALDHVLISGPPGLGKTTLANIISHELGVGIKVTSGPAIERAGDLAAILTNLEQGDILFVDEVHRLNKTVEEVLYPAMEERKIDIIIGKGPSARTMRLDIAPFTLVAATTRIGLLSSPLRDRFGIQLRLDYYLKEDLNTIIKRSAELLSISINNEGAAEIAKRSRGTPRVTNRLLKRVRDYAEVKGDGIIEGKLASMALKMLQVDEVGLDVVDQKILHVLVERFERKPVGLNTLASAVGEAKDSLEEVYEPYLVQLGFIQKTPQGRVATKKACEHLGLKTTGSKLF